MTADFEDASADAAREGWRASAGLWSRVFVDLARAIISQWCRDGRPGVAAGTLVAVTATIYSVAWLVPTGPSVRDVSLGSDEPRLLLLMITGALVPILLGVTVSTWAFLRTTRRPWRADTRGRPGRLL